jgi:hypothetical protein
MMQLKMEAGGVPAGTYTGTFVGVVEQPADQARSFGPGLKWTWKIDGPAHVGRTASRITGAYPSPKNACGAILTALAGRPVAEGEAVDPAGFVGRRYTVLVAPGKMGNATRVETVVPLGNAGPNGAGSAEPS